MFVTINTKRNERALGAFYSTKYSGLHFRRFPEANGATFSTISGKEDNLASSAQISAYFLPGLSVFRPGISGIFS